MVSVVGYSVEALIAQVVLTYVLCAALIVVLFVRSIHRADGRWVGRWYWAMTVLVILEGVVIVAYTFPLRIGEVMLLNGLLVGAMGMAVADG